MTQRAATDVRPLAYFLTWSCYGTWLHGDRRGSVDRWTAHPGTQPLARNAGREASDRARLRAQ